MYLDEASYADYITAYKTFMLEIATVFVSNLRGVNHYYYYYSYYYYQDHARFLASCPLGPTCRFFLYLCDHDKKAGINTEECNMVNESARTTYKLTTTVFLQPCMYCNVV
jgi:hypothetical protein